jgi:hypothetical protein
VVSNPEPGAEAPGYGFFSEININIVFHFPKAMKHRAMDSWQKKTLISFFVLKMPARNARKSSTT